MTIRWSFSAGDFHSIGNLLCLFLRLKATVKIARLWHLTFLILYNSSVIIWSFINCFLTNHFHIYSVMFWLRRFFETKWMAKLKKKSGLNTYPILLILTKTTEICLKIVFTTGLRSNSENYRDVKVKKNPRGKWKVKFWKLKSKS